MAHTRLLEISCRGSNVHKDQQEPSYLVLSIINGIFKNNSLAEPLSSFLSILYPFIYLIIEICQEKITIPDLRSG